MALGSPAGLMIVRTHGASSLKCYRTILREQAPAMKVAYGSGFPQYAADALDVSVGDIFTTRTRGGRLCIFSDHEWLDNLAGFVEGMRVNQTCMTSSVASLLRSSNVPTL